MFFGFLMMVGVVLLVWSLSGSSRAVSGAVQTNRLALRFAPKVRPGGC